MENIITPELIIPEPLVRLSKDLKEAAKTLSAAEARFLVDTYYQMQDGRIRADGQRRAIDGDADAGVKPHLVLDWLSDNNSLMEKQIIRALDAYSDSNKAGVWAKSIVGIGPVIAAGLLAHIDITKCPTAGHIWRYAGLDPTVRWESREKVAEWVKEREPTQETVAEAARVFGRSLDTLMKYTEKLTLATIQAAISRCPWNQQLKVLAWKIGESFVKQSGRDSDVYGKIYLSRKALETERNESGAFTEQAADKLRRFKIGKDTDAYKAYDRGRVKCGLSSSRTASALSMGTGNCTCTSGRHSPSEIPARNPWSPSCRTR